MAEEGIKDSRTRGILVSTYNKLWFLGWSSCRLIFFMVWESIKLSQPLKLHKEVLNPAFGGMKFLVIGLTCAVIFLRAGVVYGVPVTSEEIRVYLNESKIVTVNKPKRIAIGNPDTVDVVNASDDIIILSPKARGTTNLMIWDSSGIHSYRIKVVGGDMQEMKLRVDEILEELRLTSVQTKISEDDERVFLFGEVRSLQDKDLLNLALGPLRQKVTNLIKIREEDMVEIEAQVIELNKDGTKTLGFTWPGSLNFTEKGSEGIGTTGAPMSSLFKILNYSRDQFNFSLDALIQENKARVLSKPRLACLSGKEAQLLVGGEKPIFTTEVTSSAGTGGATGTGVSYKEYGIKLKIKPVVLENNKINITLKLEVSEPGAVETIGGANTTAQAYPFSKREITTELCLNDGQTLGIGGLIKQKLDDEVRKTMFLGDIPILGVFFRNKVSRSGGGFGEKGDAELFIILTPKIVSQKKEATDKAAAASAVISSMEAPKAASVKAEEKKTPAVLDINQNVPDAVKKEAMEKEVYATTPIKQIVNKPAAEIESKPEARAAVKKEEQKASNSAIVSEPKTAAAKKEAMEKELAAVIASTPVVSKPVAAIESKPEAESKGSVSKSKETSKPLVDVAINKEAVSYSVKKEALEKEVYSAVAVLPEYSLEYSPDLAKKESMEQAVFSTKPIEEIIPRFAPSVSTAVVMPKDKQEPAIEEEENPLLTVDSVQAKTDLSEDNKEAAKTVSAEVNKVSSDSIVEYANTIRKAILEKLSYPSLAKQRNMQGRVKLRLHISSLGELIEVFVKESSTYEILDYNTLSAAKNIITYPPFPSAITLDDLWLEIPIDYKLDQKQI